MSEHEVYEEEYDEYHEDEWQDGYEVGTLAEIYKENRDSDGWIDSYWIEQRGVEIG